MKSHLAWIIKIMCHNQNKAFHSVKNCPLDAFLCIWNQFYANVLFTVCLFETEKRAIVWELWAS